MLVGNEGVLEQMGVDVIDRGWQTGGPQRTLDEHLYPEYGFRADPSPSGSRGAPYGTPGIDRAIRPERTGPIQSPRLAAEQPPEPVPEPPAPQHVRHEGPAPSPAPPQGQRPRGSATAPKEVKRHAEAAAESGYAGAIPDIPPMGMGAVTGRGREGPVVGSLGMGVDFGEDQIAANARQFLAGGPGPELPMGEPGDDVTIGRPALDTTTGEKVTVLSVVGGTATVRYLDSPATAEVDVSDLRGLPA